MKDDKGTMKSSGKENHSVVENGKKKPKEERPLTKIVVRRLPPTMTEEQFKMQVSPLPEIDYFYFVPADMTLTPNTFSRAYINFVDQSDLFIFTQKFDGYVFIDSKGGEFPAVVEFAPFQRIPKNRPNRKKDPKVGTIESDQAYIQFKEYLEAVSLENRTSANVSKQHFFETSLENEIKEIISTPLLDYVKNERAEKQRNREEKREEKRKRDLERKRVKEEQRRTKKEDDSSVLKVLNNQTVNSKERVREKEVKPSYLKKKLDDVKLTPKEKSSTESRSKDGKIRTGKSYLEERQRQAERREEQRKKLSQTQSSTSVTDAKSSSSDNKAVVNEDNLPEENPSELEIKAKESDGKKPERTFKREEGRRSSYKYESKRDIEDSRRQRRMNERSYQNSRRDEDRPEDNSRKRYSETRRNQESPREKYKEKERNKIHGLRKTSEIKADTDKIKNKLEAQKEDNAEDEEVVETNFKEENSKIADSDRIESRISESVEIQTEENVSSGLEGKSKPFQSIDKTKPTRRKSFDHDKNRYSSSTSNRGSNRDKYTEKKRHNSVGYSKQQESSDAAYIKNKDFSNSEPKELNLTKSENQAKLDTSENENKIQTNKDLLFKEGIVTNDVETKDMCIPKRRNSTGETVSPEKVSSRRNSLGSEDKHLVYNFEHKEPKNTTVMPKENNKEEKKQPRNSRDPRTERRIRNKDRPSLEIYRPGMGKFSKQRLEREKGLGSSTEVESPSSSPSPTPVMKHKILSGSQH